jgi:hypothetical protein
LALAQRREALARGTSYEYVARAAWINVIYAGMLDVIAQVPAICLGSDLTQFDCLDDREALDCEGMAE